MTRGYFLRLLVWAVLVIGFGLVAGFWFNRTVPAAVQAMMAEPKEPTGSVKKAEPLQTDLFPGLAKYVNRPLEWARDSWLFILELLILVLSCWGIFGRPIGVYDLIHSESPRIRFVNGLMLGMVSGNALFVAYAVSMSDIPWAVSPEWTLLPVSVHEGQPGEADAVRLSGNFLLVTWLPLLVLMAAPWAGRMPDRWPALALGLAASVPVAMSLVFLGWYILQSSDSQIDWRDLYAYTPGAADKRIPRPDFPMHVIATGFTVLPGILILLLGIASRLGRPGSPVWVVCLTLWLFNATYGFISFHFTGLQFILLAFLIAVIVVANARHPYKLSLPNLEPEYSAARSGKPVSLTVSPVGKVRVPLLKAEDVLGPFCENWQRSRNTDQKPKLVVICTSGGGIRAAVWTATVLEGLERALGPSFGSQVRLLTGASGGMVSAALYAGSRIHPLAPGLEPTEVLATDSLWPTWQALFFSDTPAVVLPFYRTWDRAKSLEASWHKNAAPLRPGSRSPMATTFAELLSAERSGLAPSIVFSPLMVEDGRRLLISNLDLADLASELAPTLGTGADGKPFADRQRLSQPGLEFFRLFPQAHSRFLISTAARLSATFPYVSPAVSLPTQPPRRLVDAGFFDNYGVGLAAGWLYRHRALVRKYCRGVAVIEIRAFPLEREKTGFPADLGETQVGTGGLLSTVLAGVSTPAEALGVVRAAGAYYRNDHLLGILDAEFNNGSAALPFFVRVPFECAGTGSLSWAITCADRHEVTGQFHQADGTLAPGVAGAVAGLRAWLNQ